MSGALNLTSTGNTITITPSGSNIDLEAVTGGGGTVTSVSGVTANGFAFSISNPTTTPAIIALTTITGVLQGNGTAISAITSGGIPTSLLSNNAVTVSGVSGVTGGGSVALGSSITLGMADSIANTLAGYNNSGVFSDVSIGSNLSLSGGVLTATAGSIAGVSTITNSDGSLTISPNTGVVVATLNSANSNTWSGQQTYSAGVVQTPVALVITASVITTNAQAGNYFYVQLANGVSAFTNPTNASDSQVITYEIQQPSSGSSGTAIFGSLYDFGTTGQPSLTSGANKIDLIGFRYSGRKAAWLSLGSQLGF